MSSAFEKLKENPGSPFIIAFMIVLVSAAIALALNVEELANELAEVAYYFLVVGVVLQLISVVREEKRKVDSKR